MSSGGGWVRLDYEQTLAKLVEIVGQDLLVELRIDPTEGEPRVSSLGKLLGTPSLGASVGGGQEGDEHVVFDLDSGGTFTLLESAFLNGDWQGPEGEEDQSGGTLTVTSKDCEIKIVVLGGRVPELADDLSP